MGIATDYYLSKAGEKAYRGLKTLDRARGRFRESELKNWADATLDFQYQEGETAVYQGDIDDLQGEEMEINSRLTMQSAAFTDNRYTGEFNSRTTPITVSEDDLL